MAACLFRRPSPRSVRRSWALTLPRRLGTEMCLSRWVAFQFACDVAPRPQPFRDARACLAYGILLVATACMGAGFGFTVPALNTFAAAFFPQTVDKALLGLNALLGLGTALAPVFVALFVGLGIWWGLPVLVGGLILGLLFSAWPAIDEGGLTNNAQRPKRSKAKFLRGFGFSPPLRCFTACAKR